MTLSTLLVALAFVVGQLAWRRSDERFLPPGPKRWPRLGNFFSFPHRRVYDAFNRWQEEYGGSLVFTLFVYCDGLHSASTGDVVYVNLFRRPICIINSRESAEDPLRKRGDIYSCRPLGICENGFAFAELHYAYPVCLKDKLGRHRYGADAAGKDPLRAPQRHSQGFQRIVGRSLRHPHSEDDRPTTIGSFGKPIGRPTGGNRMAGAIPL
jgi:hypothetical protein